MNAKKCKLLRRVARLECTANKVSMTSLYNAEVVKKVSHPIFKDDGTIDMDKKGKPKVWIEDKITIRLGKCCRHFYHQLKKEFA